MGVLSEQPVESVTFSVQSVSGGDLFVGLFLPRVFKRNAYVYSVDGSFCISVGTGNLYCGPSSTRGTPGKRIESYDVSRGRSVVKLVRNIAEGTISASMSIDGTGPMFVAFRGVKQLPLHAVVFFDNVGDVVTMMTP